MKVRRSGPMAVPLAFAAALRGAAGCAADLPQGLDRLLWNEVEKKRLDDAGFPQYSDGAS